METAIETRSGKARIRIHGAPDIEKIKKATKNYMKKAEKCKRKEKNVTSSI